MKNCLDLAERPVVESALSQVLKVERSLRTPEGSRGDLPSALRRSGGIVGTTRPNLGERDSVDNRKERWMGTTTFGIPTDLAMALVQAAPVRHPRFVETGTFMGGTSAWAAGNFREVHTIEIAQVLYDRARVNFANVPNVKLHLGDSSAILPRILLEEEVPSVFWLDGHWCGGESGGEDSECPLLRELEIINTLAHPESILLIDDARLFLAPPPRPHNRLKWPDIGEITACLHQDRHPRRVRIVDDVIVCVPVSLGPVLDGILCP